ncbi:CAP domain-containing protein [Sphingosinicella sp. BN140058]|uniref:CAP domain-containing protein n=1 Tax=Sphingosinicella sp. BN140058 TaxID=1892855 RepID=UPI001012E489|nr:CAP domain-containing protein [Sphingosinicella sp. BN140058]QAY75959.1 SCP-like extracellular [Sphingosinicella sp. BN140058]
MERGRSDWRRAGLALAILLVAPLIGGATGRLTSLEPRLLAAHNQERAAAGLPPLLWDDALAADAGAWGETLAQVDDIEHSPDDPDDPDPQGENLWLGTRGYYAPEAMVGMWIEEKKHYRPGIFPANSRTGNLDDVGHYTQLMWRDTDRVGCALAETDDNEILVCRYLTAGNVEGERPF